jgi:arylamine N-acetyltransferase
VSRSHVSSLADGLAREYLALLGVPVEPGGVDARHLGALQRAHLARFPYETVDIVRGAPPGIDPVRSVARLVAGRGGYCYHLNGAFSELLAWLGVDVVRHCAGVQGRWRPEPQGADGNHLALTVALGDGTLLVDVGLGDGPAEPLPLRAGEHEVDGLVYTLRPSVADPGGWRFDHEPAGSFVGFDVAPGVVEMESFAGMHEQLSTDSGFSRVVTVQRRTATGVEVLRGCVLDHGPGEPPEELDSEDEWWAVVIDHFGLAYADLSAAERHALWTHVRATHEEWDAAGRP